MIEFFCSGTPRPQGSKKAMRLTQGSRAGTMIMVESSKQLEPWRNDVAMAARKARGSQPMLEGAVAIVAVFVLVRPRGHYGTRGRLPSAPLRPVVAPDFDKLLRAIDDAITGILIKDDAQICTSQASKVYGAMPGVIVRVQSAPAALTADELDVIRHAGFDQALDGDVRSSEERTPCQTPLFR